MVIFELLQLLSKVKEGEWYEYFGVQNITEFVMFILTAVLFGVQWHDHGMKFGDNDLEPKWSDDQRYCSYN